MRDFNYFDFIIQKQRFKQITKCVPEADLLLDIGCGCYPFFLESIGQKVKKRIGIDKDIPTKSILNVEFIKTNVVDKLDFDSCSINVITMLAVLEHFEDPNQIIKECERILAKDGKLIITIPSFYSKPLLMVLAKLGIISKEEIYDHKNWFKKQELSELIIKNKLVIEKSSYYNFGMNVFLVCKK